MTRALLASGKSQLGALLDRLHLDPDERVRLCIVMAARSMKAANLDRRGLLAMVDDTLASEVVEGRGHAA
jgi:hypothetical protein